MTATSDQRLLALFPGVMDVHSKIMLEYMVKLQDMNTG
jgi:hypothetical protein